MADNQITLTYDGDLIADYHKHIGRHRNKLWDVANIRVYGNKNNAQSDLLMNRQCEGKNDQQAQHYTVSVGSGSSWADYTGFSFYAGHSGCNCGSSGVSQSAFYLSDTQAPYIKSIYAATDEAGNHKVPLSGGYKAGETGYIVLEFNEYIRFGNNQTEVLTLNLDAFRISDDQQAGSVTADLISLKENKMIFKFTVADGQNVSVTGISGTQNWVKNSRDFEYVLNGADGKALSTGNVLDLNTTSKITDLAGNGIDWSKCQKQMNRFYLDTTSPTLQKIEISGSKISGTAASGGGIDRSSVFAGAGDELNFSAYFSEELDMSGLALENVSAVLNIRDAQGNPVTLKAERTEVPSAKSVSGVNASSGQITKIIFEKLTIEEGMTPAAADGSTIQIVGISGLESVNDLRGNALDSVTTVTLPPLQQEYLDTLAPVASTSIPQMDGEYIPISSGSEIFTFPVTVNDDKSADGGTGEYASGVTGITGSFSLTQEGEEKEFWWYVDTTEGISENAAWKTGKTSPDAAGAEKYALLQMEGTDTAYIHIKLDADTNYNYSPENKIYFRGTLNIYARDCAGNISETPYPVAHDGDQDLPAVKSTGSSLAVDYGTLTATLAANLKITDNHGIASVQYYWDDDSRNPQEVTLDSTTADHPFLTEQEISLPGSFTFDGSNESRAGSRKLTVMVTDISDNLLTWSEEYSYDFTKLMSDYNIVPGTRENPCSVPSISISLPKKTDGTVNESARTMVLIPAGTENGSNVYYAYLPYDSVQNGSDLFEDMPDTSEGDISQYQYADYWFRLTGSITEDGGTFSSVEHLDSSRVYQIKEWLMQQYCSMDLIFVTSETLYNNGSVLTSFDYLNSEATVETETVCLANNADYYADIRDIKNAEGESIAERLAYVNDGTHVPVPTLDGAEITLNITNQTEADSAEALYGFHIFDLNASYVTLNYLSDGKDGTQSVEKYTWKLGKAAEQTIQVPQGITDTTGWYQLKITLVDVTGAKKEFVNGSYFVYPVQAGINLEAYYRTYGYLGDSQTARGISVRNEENLGSVSELIVGVAEAPEGWTLSPEESSYARNELVFRSGKETETADCTVNVKMRAWSKADPEGETNAAWLSFDGDASMSYTPVCVEEFTKESYSAGGSVPVLPLAEGDNVVCYQIMNTNGTIESKEIMIHAVTTVSEFELQSEKTPVKEIIAPVISDNTKLLNPQFGYIGSRSLFGSSSEASGLPEITFINSGDCCFYLYNSYGNLASKYYEVTDVDGVVPYNLHNTAKTNYGYVDNNSFYFQFDADDSGGLSPEDIYLAFDTDYSALLMGLTGEDRRNNTEQVVVNIPVNMEKGEDGYEVWESYDSQHYGIYRTQILEYDGYSCTIEVWGTFQYDDTVEEYGEIERTLSTGIYDKNGNDSWIDTTCTYYNVKPSLNIGAMNSENAYVGYSSAMVDEEGNLGVFSRTPLKTVLSYGAADMQFNIEEHRYYPAVFYTTLPMITSDGVYEITYIDLFDNIYTQQLQVNAFSSTDIQIEVSDKEYTNKDIVVTAMALNQGDTITSITADMDGTVVEGMIHADNPAMADLIMTANGTVTVTTEQGKTHSMRILNIDKTLEKAQIVYSYNGASEPELVEGSEDTVSEKITAILQCEESVDGINGPLSYTFPKGSARGTEYTFEYRDAAGNTGSMTAVLPYNIAEDTEEIPEVDTQAPEYTISVHGMRSGNYTYLADYNTPEDGTEMSEELAEYRAQKYAMIFNIRDDSDTRLIIKNKGAQAPVSYEAESDTVSGVLAEDTIITVFENTEFDIYVIDEADNVTALTGVKITGVDHQAPAVEVEYKTIKDDNGVSLVRTEFIPEGGEAITSWDSDVHTYLTEIPASDGQAAGYAVRYYYDFTKNGEFTFHYYDIYGNQGTAVASVQGMDTENPVVQTVTWYGTENNAKPSESAAVNRDITAVLNISKAVNQVKLYRYDESAEDQKGEEITDSALVTVSFHGKNVSITYKQNTDGQILAEIYASSNGKMVSCILPEISCIDKTPPQVTETKAETSDNHTAKVFTFTTDEGTKLSENSLEYNTEFRTEHTWTASDSKTTVLHFMDAAGNITEYAVDVSDVDDELLTLSYSKNADGSGAVEDALTLDLEAGDTVYIMANKAAEVSVNDTVQMLEKHVWTSFVLDGESGFYAVKAEDASTGRIVYGNLAVQLKDATAPVITLDSATIYIKAGSSAEDLKNLVYSGVSIQDSRDGVIRTYEVSGMPKTAESGLYEITYTAKDSSGNTAAAKRILYIYSAGMPLITINGEAAQPFGTTVTDSTAIQLNISQAGAGSPVVKWKAGIKTSGQMKYGAARVEDLSSFTVPSPGFYTIYIRTQSRIEFVTYIYVEE